MSVGGKVIGVTFEQGHARLFTEDETRGDRLIVRVVGAPDVRLGDSIWWQGRIVYWSRRGEFQDRPLSKIGYSHRHAAEPRGEDADRGS